MSLLEFAMRACRKVVLLLVCLCLAVGGRVVAMPMDASMPSHDEATGSMLAACAGLDEEAGSISSIGQDVEPAGPSRSDCCRPDACPCAALHAFAMAACPVVVPQARIGQTTVVPLRTAGYASPVPARLSRPPIA